MSTTSERSICSSCGSFVATANVHKIDDHDGLIPQRQNSLDQCGHHEGSRNFCDFCYTARPYASDYSQVLRSKFRQCNYVSTLSVCALEDLTVVEECLIAKCHPVGTILDRVATPPQLTTTCAVIPLYFRSFRALT
jgi:hypothetical protein